MKAKFIKKGGMNFYMILAIAAIILLVFILMINAPIRTKIIALFKGMTSFRQGLS